MKSFPDNEITGKLDFIFLAGDVYHSNLNHSSDDVIEIDCWIAYMLRICKKWDIKLRVLLGTRSHDYQQSKRFVAINEYAKIHADVAYYSDICIVHEKEENINILYVPDDMDRDTDKIFHTVRSLMVEKGLEAIDFAIMHGQFDYQLPAVVQAPKHDPDKYLSIIKHLIFIGHVHVYSAYERIFAQGSFDRDGHGEENPKGHIRFIVDLDTCERDVQFVVNEDAKIFKTIKVVNKDPEKALELLRKAILNKIPDGSCVRIKAPKDHPIHASMGVVVSMFPLITFSRDILDDERDGDSPNLIEKIEHFIPITLTPENLLSMVMDRLRARLDDEQLIEACQFTLKANL